MRAKDLIVYQTDSGAIELPVDAAAETIWATQKQIADVFGVNVRTVNEHLSNIFSTEELEKGATIRKIQIVRTEGKREVKREIEHYNLDAIISVGYRVNSKNATIFRKWATKTLRAYIADGFLINPSRIEYNKSQFLRAIEDMKLLAANSSAVGSTEVADLVQVFTGTWFSLDAYDKNELPHAGGVKQALTAITLLVAESKPSEKDRMIGLVLSMLGVSAR